MTVRQAKHKFDDLPVEIPIFPLGGVLLLPGGQLPLNIFEPRYLAMVEEALKGHRLIGMVQPKEDGATYTVGCAGRITSFNETADGRNEIVLTGICRFRIGNELPQQNGYRRARVDWTGFNRDMEPMACLDMDRERLKKLLKAYFAQQGLTCSWEAVDSAGDEKLITSLAMICPLSPSDKQALLETQCCKDRAKMFITLLEMEIGGCGSGCSHKH